ncbi:hypothetical protein BsWGS_26348 [Bradybaena similaris]
MSPTTTENGHLVHQCFLFDHRQTTSSQDPAWLLQRGRKIRRHFTDQLQLSGFTKHILIRTVIPRGMHPGLTDDVIFEGQAIEGAGGLMDDDYNGSEVDSVVPKCDIDAPPTPIRVTFNVGGVVFQTLEKTVKHVAKVSPTVKHMGKVSSQ